MKIYGVPLTCRIQVIVGSFGVLFPKYLQIVSHKRLAPERNGVKLGPRDTCKLRYSVPGYLFTCLKMACNSKTAGGRVK